MCKQWDKVGRGFFLLAGSGALVASSRPWVSVRTADGDIIIDQCSACGWGYCNVVLKCRVSGNALFIMQQLGTKTTRIRV